MMKPLSISLALIAAASSSALAQQSDLLVEMTAPEHGDPDSDVSFQLTVTNGGADDAVSVALSDPLPAGMTFVSLSSDPDFSCMTPVVGANGSVSCTAATLAVADPASFTLVVHIDAATPAGTFFTNIASVSNANNDPTSENDSATAVVQTPPPPPADVMVTVQGPSATVPDTDVTYLLEVINGGPDPATHVTLTAPIPGSLLISSLTQSGSATFSCSTSDPITCTIASLPGGSQGTFTIVGHVPPATGDGDTFTLVATATSDYDPTVENDETATAFCVQPNHCNAGGCHAAVVCPLATACHDQGACNPLDGVCAPNAPQTGSACDDGDGCTQTDSCQAGVCTGSDPVVCPVAGQCQIQGSCDSGTGTCAANASKSDGTVCNDHDACTQSDACASGACVGGDPVVCTALDECHDSGSCNSANSTCSQPAKANGSACDDGNACTGASSCQSGACTGSDPVVCPAAGSCQLQGACNPSSGSCAANAPKPNGSACDDDDACTDDDACASGACSGSAHSCDDGNACTTDSCDPALGCAHVAVCTADASVAPNDDDAGEMQEPTAGSGGGEHDASTGSAGKGGSKPDASTGSAGHGGAGSSGSKGDAGGENGGSDDSSDDCNCRIGAGASHRRAAEPLTALLLLAAALILRGCSRRRRRDEDT